MKIKIKNVFNRKDTYDEKENKNDKFSYRKYKRKGAYVDNNKFKEINLKKYFDNLFKNKNKLSKGYYILLFAMLILGGASVAITFKAYNLFSCTNEIS